MKKLIYITFCLSILLTQTSLIFTDLFLESVGAYTKENKVILNIKLNANYELKSFAVERKIRAENFSRIYFTEIKNTKDYSNIIIDNIEPSDEFIYRVTAIDKNNILYTSTEFKINDKTDLSKIWDSIKSLFR
ncbi:MAG: hypothetical protein JW866_07560 [Ignavibacteriales bacterium]|nr:hypothetical protein [Ignavibacteriales bacterium]